MRVRPIARSCGPFHVDAELARSAWLSAQSHLLVLALTCMLSDGAGQRMPVRSLVLAKVRRGPKAGKARREKKLRREPHHLTVANHLPRHERVACRLPRRRRHLCRPVPALVKRSIHVKRYKGFWANESTIQIWPSPNLKLL